MALKLKITKAEYEKLSDAKKEEYLIEADGSYKLDLEGEEDNGPLKRALERERESAKTSKTRLAEIEAELDAMRTESATKNKDVDTLNKQFEKKLGETTAQYNERLAKRDSFIQATLIDSVASKVASKISLAPALLLPHLKARMQVNFDGDEPTTVILGTDGKPSKMTIDELQAEFVANRDFSAIIKASNASGGASSGKSGGGAPKPSSNNTADLSKMSPADLAAHLESSKTAA
jgi:hypothetical protein